MNGFVKLLCILRKLRKSTFQDNIFIFQRVHDLLLLISQLFQLILDHLVILFRVLEMPEPLFLFGLLRTNGPVRILSTNTLILPRLFLEVDKVSLLLDSLAIMVVPSPLKVPNSLACGLKFFFKIFFPILMSINPESTLLKLHRL